MTSDPLPDGATCASCVHLPVCWQTLGRDGAERECHWQPSRYVSLTVRETADATANQEGPP